VENPSEVGFSVRVGVVPWGQQLCVLSAAGEPLVIKATVDSIFIARS
jgi:hypothetical protein